MEITVDFFKQILDFVPCCVYFKDTDCKYVYASRYPGDPLEAEKYDVQGLTDFDIIKDPVAAQHAVNLTKQVLETGKGVAFVNDFSLPDKPIFLDFKMEPVRNKEGKIIGVIGILNDITERILLEKKLESYARTDSLTGLYNRFYLDYWRSNELQPSIFPLYIVAADCDNLKQINDTHGHHIGDEYIRLSTSVLRVALPEKAIKFRSGGDEFIALIPNTTKEEGNKLVKTMEDMSKNITIKGTQISISFGGYSMNSITEDFDDALKKADDSMYLQKKKHHRGRDSNKKKILVSACLLGSNCKYDGTNNLNDEINKFLTENDCEIITVCPEVAGGLSTPRVPSEIKEGAVINKDGVDVSKEFNSGADKCLQKAIEQDIYAAILKSNSPSCGAGKIYDGTFSGKLTTGDGIFAAKLKASGIKIYNENNFSELTDL